MITTVPPAPLRVAALQAAAIPGDLPGNAATAARLVERAGADGVRLAVLPELFLPGYQPETLHDRPGDCDVTAGDGGRVADARLDALSDATSRHGVTVLAGASVRAADGGRYLAALLVDADGTVTDAYHKRHLCGSEEKDLFAAGTEAASLEIDGWLFGLGICYDGCLPEHARAAADAGAHGYLCPAAYVADARQRKDLYYRARALDNTFFVVLSNAVDGPDPGPFCGGSAVHDPQGRPLATAPESGEAVLAVDLDPELLAATRADHPLLADHRAVAEPAARRLLTAHG